MTAGTSQDYVFIPMVIIMIFNGCSWLDDDWMVVGLVCFGLGLAEPVRALSVASSLAGDPVILTSRRLLL